MDDIRISIRTLKGSRVILLGLLKDYTTDFQKWCCRDSEGFCMLSIGIIQGCILWDFYKDPKGNSIEILYRFLQGLYRNSKGF